MKDGVVDASLLLTLGDVRALHLLSDDPTRRWHVTPIVRDEVASEPTRSEVSRAVVDGGLGLAELDTDSSVELGALVHWNKIVDPGEAEAIAIAMTRGWTVGIEDLYAQRRLREAGWDGWVNSATLLVEAIEADRLSLAEADAIFTSLDCYSGYAKRGVETLRELIER